MAAAAPVGWFEAGTGQYEKQASPPSVSFPLLHRIPQQLAMEKPPTLLLWESQSFHPGSLRAPGASRGPRRSHAKELRSVTWASSQNTLGRADVDIMGRACVESVA